MIHLWKGRPLAQLSPFPFPFEGGMLVSEKPVILVVEDGEYTGSELKAALAELPDEIVNMYGIHADEFEVIWLRNGRDAVQWLLQAKDGRKIVVLVLDLHLPETDEPGQEGNTDVGLHILDNHSQVCSAVLVHTQFDALYLVT